MDCCNRVSLSVLMHSPRVAISAVSDSECVYFSMTFNFDLDLDLDLESFLVLFSGKKEAYDRKITTCNL